MPVPNARPGETTARPQRILMLQNSSLFEGYGGIEYYQDDFLTLAAEIWGEESVACVAPRRRPDTPAPERPYHVSLVPFGAPSPLRPLENRYSPALFREARRLATRLKPTVILGGHVTLGPLAYALSRATGVPYGMIAYGIEVWGDFWPQDLWALRRARTIYSISEWTKGMLVKQGFRAERIQVVHPMLPRAYEKMPKPRRPKPGDGPFTLLTISRLDAGERYKGQDHVLHALYRLRYSDSDLPLRYIIQGDGTDRSRLESLVGELELGDVVEFRPAVRDRSQFETAYREADLYVMPSRFGRWGKRWRGEGFGIVYLEAAAFGVPSIAYDCGGATDIIRHGVNGLLLVPDSITDLANGIVMLARNRQLAFEMGQKAHAEVMARFTREPVRREMVAAFNRT